MKRSTLLALLLVSAIAFAEPYRLKLLSERTSQKDGSIQTVRTFQVEGSPFRLLQTSLSQRAVEVHEVEVFRGEETNHRAAYSQFFVFREKGVTTASVMAYRKFDESPEAKGLGTLVLQPLLDIQEVSQISAELAHTNFRRMANELESRGVPESATSFNEVVMTHSHLGKVLADAGFETAPERTRPDQFRGQVFFSFHKPQKPDDVSPCSWLVGNLAKVVQIFQRRRP